MAEWGVLFDLDGVLIDSHDQHREAWFRLAEIEGLSLTKEQFSESFGMRNETCIPHVFHWADASDTGRIRYLGDRKEEAYRDLLREGGLDPLPGVLDLLRELESAGIPRCVASSTARLNIEVCLESTGIAPFFGDGYVGAEDVTRGKPDPEVFLKASERVGLSPANCLVIEDAHVGVEAALSGGMKVVAVTTTHPRESFTGYATSMVVDSLEELAPANLSPLFRGMIKDGP